MKKVLASFAIFTIVALIVLTLFPPWTTIMGSYPKVSYHCVISRPPPIEHSGDGKERFEYRIDVERLQFRYAFTLISFIAVSAVAWLTGTIRARN